MENSCRVFTWRKKNSAINRAWTWGIRACFEYESRNPKPHELIQMGKDLEEALKAGAFGMSSGLIFPGCYATKKK